jgi:hypothetical protein
MLYAGTTKPLARREWQRDVSSLPVAALSERDCAVKTHFGNPEVQNIGSTCGCGCAFPSLNLHDGQWPAFQIEEDAERDADERENRELLVALLRESGEKVIELYGVWDGDFTKSPQATEEIPLERILETDFRFKERGFYRVINQRVQSPVNSS